MRNRGRPAQLACSVSIAVFAMLSVSYAEPSPPAAAAAGSNEVQIATHAFWEGKRLYDSGHFELALNQFETAYRLIEDPTLLYNIAQSYRQLDDCAHAKDAYAKFRTLAPNSPLVAQAEAHLAELERSCPAAPSPQDAHSTTDTPPRNAPVVARAPELRRDTTTTETPAPPGATTPPSASEASRRSARLATAPKSGVEATRLYLTLTALAAGLVAGGTAAGLGFWNRGRHEDWKTQDASLAKGNASSESDSTWASRQQRNDELIHSIARTDRVVGYLSAVSGALFVGSALLYFTAPHSTVTAKTTRKALGRAWCVPTVLGLNNYHVSVQTTF